MSPPLVVLAAGLARRFGGCKPLAPIGPNGEAVLDLLVSDAVAAGFGQIVLVLHPETGPAIRYHVEWCWPRSVEVTFAEQRFPLGTVHAVLAARETIGPEQSFGVCNADDVYGEEPMHMLTGALDTGTNEHALIGYRLGSTVSTGDPVTRGVCDVDGNGHLLALRERRRVRRGGDGNFTAEDDLEPVALSADLPASVNLWGFRPSIWDVLASAMQASGLDEDTGVAASSPECDTPSAEVLLPEVVAAMVADGSGSPIRVIATDAKLVGVTHAADLPVVTAELARHVAWGTRPGQLWGDAV